MRHHSFTWFFLFIVAVTNTCINDYDTIFSMFFVNNYTIFMLSIIDMAFRGIHDADPSDPSVLVLQDRHRSHLVDTEKLCILLIILLHIVTCNLYIINYKNSFFITCSSRKYSTLDSR